MNATRPKNGAETLQFWCNSVPKPQGPHSLIQSLANAGQPRRPVPPKRAARRRTEVKAGLLGRLAATKQRRSGSHAEANARTVQKRCSFGAVLCDLAVLGFSATRPYIFRTVAQTRRAGENRRRKRSEGGSLLGQFPANVTRSPARPTGLPP